ncbi:hypothetical protein [Capnocytophaga sp.]|uniref:hypothetical protein n=1 Tax=Capnocytophaga sp. TaxID=44737 RepID=UPI0026DDAF58|nr:hypothetical protein [Capnocytophaga sp.]MDO5104838.1 hypothetical protein [Capnocytophaga sp.]
MKLLLSWLLVVFAVQFSQAQFIKQKAIEVKVGNGSSMSTAGKTNVVVNGFASEGTFVLKIKSWFELRPYMGFITAKSIGKDFDNNPTPEKTQTKAFYLGGKARVKAPIRWVAPYLELGRGLSVGSFKNVTLNHNEEVKGLAPHAMFSLGLALGRNGNVDLSFSTYLLPSANQIMGGFFIGMAFPIK